MVKRAFKVLPETVAHDPERLARFQREAQSVALFWRLCSAACCSAALTLMCVGVRIHRPNRATGVAGV